MKLGAQLLLCLLFTTILLCGVVYSFEEASYSYEDSLNPPEWTIHRSSSVGASVDSSDSAAISSIEDISVSEEDSLNPPDWTIERSENNALSSSSDFPTGVTSSTFTASSSIFQAASSSSVNVQSSEEQQEEASSSLLHNSPSQVTSSPTLEQSPVASSSADVFPTESETPLETTNVQHVASSPMNVPSTPSESSGTAQPPQDSTDLAFSSLPQPATSSPDIEKSTTPVPQESSEDTTVEESSEDVAASSDAPVDTSKPSFVVVKSTLTSGVFPRTRNLLIELTASERADEVVYEWTIRRNGATVTFTDFASSAQSDNFIRIPSGKLTAGATFTFTVTAYYSSVGSEHSTQRTFTVQVSSPPTVAAFNVSPTTGEALSTRFTMSVANWVDTNGGTLRYIFAYVDEDGQDVLLNSLATNTTVTARLPQGSSTNSNSLTLRVTAYTSVGDSASTTLNVVVNPLSSTAVLSTVLENVNSLTADDPQFFGSSSVALKVLSTKTSGPMSSAERTQTQTILKSVATNMLTAISRITQVDRTAAASITQSLVLLVQSPSILDEDLITEVGDATLQLLNAPSDQDTYLTTMFDSFVVVANNLESGRRQFSSTNKFVKVGVDIVTAAMSKISSTLSPGDSFSAYKDFVNILARYTSAATLGSSALPVGDSSRSLQAVTQVQVQLSSGLRSSLSGSVYTNFVVYEAPSVEYVNSNETSMIPAVVEIGVQTSSGNNVDTQLQDLFLVTIPVSNSPSYQANYFPQADETNSYAPTCRYLSSTWSNDTTVCYVHSSDANSVTCACNRFTTVALTLDLVIVDQPGVDSSDTTIVPRNKKSGLSAGGAVGIVIAILAVLIIVGIIFALVTICICMQLRRKKRVEKAFANSKDITRYMTDENHFELEDI